MYRAGMTPPVQSTAFVRTADGRRLHALFLHADSGATVGADGTAATTTTAVGLRLILDAHRSLSSRLCALSFHGWNHSAHNRSRMGGAGLP